MLGVFATIAFVSVLRAEASGGRLFRENKLTESANPDSYYNEKLKELGKITLACKVGFRVDDSDYHIMDYEHDVICTEKTRGVKNKDDKSPLIESCFTNDLALRNRATMPSEGTAIERRKAMERMLRPQAAGEWTGEWTFDGGNTQVYKFGWKSGGWKKREYQKGEDPMQKEKRNADKHCSLAGLASKFGCVQKHNRRTSWRSTWSNGDVVELLLSNCDSAGVTEKASQELHGDMEARPPTRASMEARAKKKEARALLASGYIHNGREEATRELLRQAAHDGDGSMSRWDWAKVESTGYDPFTRSF